MGDESPIDISRDRTRLERPAELGSVIGVRYERRFRFRWFVGLRESSKLTMRIGDLGRRAAITIRLAIIIGIIRALVGQVSRRLCANELRFRSSSLANKQAQPNDDD